MSQLTKNYGAITDLDTLKKLIDKLGEEAKPIGYDIETGYDGPDRKKGALFPAGNSFTVGFSITNDISWARYVPLRHDFGINLDPDIVWPLMKPLLEQKLIVAHHAKFEAKFARQVGINLGVLADTMLISYVLAEWPGNGLKDLVFYIFAHKMAEIESLFPGATNKQLDALRFNILDQSNPEVVAYACEDSAWCLAIKEKEDARAQLERPFMYGLEHQISEIMTDVELWGNAVNWPAMLKERQYAEPFLAKWANFVKTGLGEMAGRDLSKLNFNSTKQMRELLYDELGFTTTVKTPKGAESTSEQALKGLSKEHAPIKSLLQLREIENLVNRHVLWLEEKPGAIPISGRDGRVHANYGQAIVPTGRFAANDPAIQQLPKEWFWALPPYSDWMDAATTDAEMDEVKERIKREAPPYTYWMGNFRDYIVPTDDYYFLSYDYSQIELRIVAGLSQEPALVKAFNEGTDVHTVTAGLMLNKDIGAVTKDDRAMGKTFNFALTYGMGIQSLAERLAVSVDKAKSLYNDYFATFSSIKTWMAKAKDQGRAKGYTETSFGRKMTVWELKSANKGVRAKADRAFGNYPVQGGGADYMKVAMVRATKALKKKGWWGDKVKLVANLHDALTFEVHESLNPAEVRALLEPCVVFPLEKFPKIVADWEVGYKWGSSTNWKANKEPHWNGNQWVLRTIENAPEVAFLDDDDEDYDEDLEIVESVSMGDDPVIDDSYEPSDEKTLVIEIKEMPTVDQFNKFMSLLHASPGEYKPLLRTPDGDVIVDSRTRLGIEDQARFSLVLGGAIVYFLAEDVSDEDLFSGLAV